MKVVKELGFDQVGEALREAASVVNVIGAKKRIDPPRSRFASEIDSPSRSIGV
jgi:hypothetical protein